MSWSRAFDDRIPLPRSRQLVTLKDAANYIQRLPKAEQDFEEWQAAVEALLLVVELNGPTMMARIGIMRALNRGYVREFNSSSRFSFNDAGNGRTKTPFQGGPLQRGHLPNGNLRRDEACRRNLARARLDKITARQISQATANDSLVEISA